MMDDSFENIILVLGNGFDIANKYETMYSDFIEFINLKEYRKYESVEVKQKIKVDTKVLQIKQLRKILENAFQ